MKTIPSKILLLFMVMFLPVAASASPYCLERLMDEALNNRDILRMYEISRKQAEKGVQERRAAFMPGVDASYTAHRLEDSTLFENDENASWKIAARLNLFAGFGDRSALDTARRQVEVQEALMDGLRQDIRLETALAFLGVHQALAEREVADSTRRLYAKEYEQAGTRHEVGVIRRADYLKIKVVLDDAQQAWTRADAAVNKAINQLSRTTGMALSPLDLDFSDFQELPLLKDYNLLSEKMQERRSELKILDLSSAMAEDSVAMAKSAYMPRADLSLSHGQSADNYSISDNVKDETRLTLSLSVNLFDGMKKPAVLQKSRLEIRRIAHERRETLDSLNVQLKNLLLDAEVAGKNLQVAEAGMDEAREHLRVTEYSYREGVATTTDLLDAIAYLSRASANRITARSTYLQTTFRIRHLVAELGE
ncbi:TolC family protein [Desulfobotulus mexicanus]|nr:TolC family protein [Desulfobotulus mexicanus]